MTWAADGDGLVLDVEVDFVGPWRDTPYMHRDIWVPRLGLLFGLPGADDVRPWFGRGPGETYVDSFEGSRVVAFDASIDELQVALPRAAGERQSRAARGGSSSPALGFPPLRVEGRPRFDFTARRWTSLRPAARPQAARARRHGPRVAQHRSPPAGSRLGIRRPRAARAVPVPRERTTWSVRLASR